MRDADKTVRIERRLRENVLDELAEVLAAADAVLDLIDVPDSDGLRQIEEHVGRIYDDAAALLRLLAH